MLIFIEYPFIQSNYIPTSNLSKTSRDSRYIVVIYDTILRTA